MRTIVVLSLIAAVWGHAALNAPTAFNPNPSKTSPCGGGSTIRVGLNSGGPWMPGQQITNAVTWQVIAGDGVGALTFKVDTRNGQSFTGANARDITSSFTGTTPTAVATYTYNFQVPDDLNCTGGPTQNLCTLQVASSSNWFACTTLAIGAAANGTTAPSAAPTRVLAQGLTTCAAVNNKTIMVPVGSDLSAMEESVNVTIASYLPNKNVFSHSSYTGCREAFVGYLCGRTFQLPAFGGVANPCMSSCLAFRQICGLNATHNNLYICGTNAGSDAAGSCSQWHYSMSSTGGAGVLDDKDAAFAAQPLAILIAALAVLVAALRA